MNEPVDPTPAGTCTTSALVTEFLASSPGITCAAPTPVSEYLTPIPDFSCAALAPEVVYVAPMLAVTFTAPAPVSDAAPAPEDEPSPALVAAKRHLVNLRVRGLWEGDPEFDFAVEHCMGLAARTSRRNEWSTGVRTDGMRLASLRLTSG